MFNNYYTTVNTSNVKTPVRTHGRIIGSIEGNHFIKRVKGSLHQLRYPKAWCISEDAFHEQIRPKTDIITIEDTETGTLYTCSTELFSEYCFQIQRGSFEPQLALTMEHWEVEDSDKSDQQLALWGGDSNG